MSHTVVNLGETVEQRYAVIAPPARHTTWAGMALSDQPVGRVIARFPDKLSALRYALLLDEPAAYSDALTAAGAR